MNSAESPLNFTGAALSVAFSRVMRCCEDLHRRCGGKLVQPVEKLLGGGCGADGTGIPGSWSFSDQLRLFNHLRACVSIVADFLCTIFPLLSPVCVDPPVRHLWKTSPEPRPAQLPEACSRIDQQSRQATDPQLLFPSGAGCGKLSTMPVGRTAQKVWTTCPQIAAGHGRRALAFAVRFLINRRKYRRYWPAAKYA
jgi:hypothetical protein